MAVTVTALDVKYATEESSMLALADALMSETGKSGDILDVYLVSDAFVASNGAELLERYRALKGKNSRAASFNVLSFPAKKDFPHPDTSQTVLGEIYLNLDHIVKHGENAVKMLIHGYLHLLGFDHETKNDKIEMETEEARLYKCISS